MENRKNWLTLFLFDMVFIIIYIFKNRHSEKSFYADCLCTRPTYYLCYLTYVLAFPTGWDSATSRDKGTKVPSLSRDKWTTGQDKNLAKGRDGPGQPVKIRGGTGQSLFFCQNPGRDTGQDNH